MTKNKLFAIMLGAALTVGAGATATVTSSYALETKAASETIDFTTKGYANGQEISTVEGTGFDIVFDKGTNNNTPKWYNSGNAIRVYGGSTVTIAPDAGAVITEVTFTFGTDDGTNEITANVGTFASPTWTGTSDENVVFTIGGTKGHRRFASVAVTYVPSTEPSLSLNKTSVISYVGTDVILEATTANIDSPTFEWSITSGDTVVSIEAVTDHPEQQKVTNIANGSATVQVSCAGLTAYCNFTVVGASTVTQAKASTDGSSVLVEGIVGDNFYGKSFSLYDADGTGINIYTYDDILGTEAVPGDKVQIFGTSASYKGLKQITNPKLVKVVSNDNTYTAKTVTSFVADNVNDYIHVENALVTAVNTVTFKLGETYASVYVHDTNSSQEAKDNLNAIKARLIPNVSTVTITGTLSCFNSSLQFYCTEQLLIVDEGNDLINFADDLLMPPCNDNGATYSSSWDEFALTYADLSQTEKDAFTNATANAEGSTLEKAAARYDFVAAKYNLNDFANRNPGSSSNDVVIGNSFNFTLLFVVVGIALAASVVTVVIIKNAKKEN